MTENPDDKTNETASDAASPPTGGSANQQRRAPWLVPVLTFVIGILLGGLILALANPAEEDAPTSSQETSAAAPTATPTVPADAIITVPGECLQVAEESQKLVELIDQAVTAVGDLNARRLSEIVADIETQQELLRTQSQACRDNAPTATQAP